MDCSALQGCPPRDSANQAPEQTNVWLQKPKVAALLTPLLTSARIKNPSIS